MISFKKLTKLSILLATMALLGSPLLANQPLVTSHVPFPFVIDRMTLPAGDYRVTQIGPAENLLLIRPESGSGPETLFIVESARAHEVPNSASLVFEVVGGKHFLSEIWKGGQDWGWRLPPSPMEAQLKASAVSREREAVPSESMSPSR